MFSKDDKFCISTYRSIKKAAGIGTTIVPITKIATIHDPSSLVMRNGVFSPFKSNGNDGLVQPNDTADENSSKEAEQIQNCVERK